MVVSDRFRSTKRQAYARLSSPTPSLGILLGYPKRPIPSSAPSRRPTHFPHQGAGQLRLAVLGAGNYASRQLIPAFAKAGAELHSLVAPPASTRACGPALPFQQAAQISKHPWLTITTVVIATRHDSHASCNKLWRPVSMSSSRSPYA